MLLHFALIALFLLALYTPLRQHQTGLLMALAAALRLDALGLPRRSLPLSQLLNALRDDFTGKMADGLASTPLLFVCRSGQRSAQAAREIKSLIDASSTQVQEGTRMVAGAGETMQQVVSGIQQVTTLVSEISGSAREQSTGVEQVNIAITEMDDSTQKNAAMVEQSSAAANSMSDQARRLKEAVDVFT